MLAIQLARNLLLNPRYATATAALLLIGELILGVLIINFQGYTEIDWRAYMEEVGGFLGGERDYLNLRGGTGPLVYPAGFVYLYAALRWITDDGTNIRRAQYIFLGIYLLTQATGFAIYIAADRWSTIGQRGCAVRTKVKDPQGGFRIQPWVLGLLCLSKRVHSIYMLRLFNDGVATLLCQIAILLLMRRRWSLGCVVYSLALSIKMNILLFLPALLLVLVKGLGPLRTLPRLALVVGTQLALGAPFILTYPHSYFSKDKWTKEEAWRACIRAGTIVLMRCIHKPLNCTRHLITKTFKGGVIPFALCQLKKIVRAGKEGGNTSVSAAFVARVMFSCNFIGIVFARTLHYQFYSWYFHAIPYLLWCTDLPTVVKVSLFLAIEAAHLIILCALWAAKMRPFYDEENNIAEDKKESVFDMPRVVGSKAKHS